MSQNQPKPVIIPTFANYDGWGVVIRKGNGAVIKTVKIKDKHGVIMTESVIACSSKKLIYWSKNDKSLCIQTKNNMRKWYSIHLDSNESISSLCTSQNGIYINIVEDRVTGRVASLTPSRVLFYNSKTLTISPVINASEVQSKGNSNIIAVRCPNGNFEIRSDNDAKSIIMDDNKHIGLFDFDPENNVICYKNGNYVDILSDKHYAIRIPFLCNVIGIKLMPESHQVWITLYSEFGEATVNIYDYSGRYMQAILSKRTLTKPITTNKEEIAFLNSLLK